MNNCNWYSDGTGNRWNASTLWKAAEGLEAKPLLVEHLATDYKESLKFAPVDYEDVDLSYPIILNPEGYIADGFHRLAKAIALGQRFIMAVKLPEMPKRDGFANLDFDLEYNHEEPWRSYDNSGTKTTPDTP